MWRSTGALVAVGTTLLCLLPILRCRRRSIRRRRSASHFVFQSRLAFGTCLVLVSRQQASQKNGTLRLCKVHAYDVRYLACPRPDVKVPTTFSGVSAYAANKLAGLLFFSYTTCALLRLKISHSSVLVIDGSAGSRTSASGVGILICYVGRIASYGVRRRRSGE
jgi:hypothetical protein